MDQNKIPASAFDFPSVEKISEILQLNNEIIKDIIKELMETIPVNFDNLQRMIDTQNRDGVKTVAHTIKGSCGNLRIEALRKLAEEIEKMNPFSFEEAINKLDKMRTCFEQLKLFYGKP